MRGFATFATTLALLGGLATAAPCAEARNKDLVKRFYEEVWQKGNLDFADQVFATDDVRHDPRGGAPAAGPAGQKMIAQSFRQSFPDLSYRVDFMLAEGDYVAARWTITGTNTGPAPAGRPSTGKRVEFVGVNVFRFGSEGKVVEIWNHRDDLAFQEQLGLVTRAAAPAASPSPRP